MILAIIDSKYFSFDALVGAVKGAEIWLSNWARESHRGGIVSGHLISGIVKLFSHS
jgi:hypothetical protein